MTTVAEPPNLPARRTITDLARRNVIDGQVTEERTRTPIGLPTVLMLAAIPTAGGGLIAADGGAQIFGLAASAGLLAGGFVLHTIRRPRLSSMAPTSATSPISPQVKPPSGASGTG